MRNRRFAVLRIENVEDLGWLLRSRRIIKLTSVGAKQRNLIEVSMTAVRRLAKGMCTLPIRLLETRRATLKLCDALR